MILAVVACLTLALTPGYVKRTIDGDTFAFYAIRIPTEEQVRVLDVDTPERGQLGFAEATLHTSQWLAQGPYTFMTCRRDNFGRLLGILSRGTDTLAVSLRTAGYGVRAANPLNRSTTLERTRR